MGRIKSTLIKRSSEKLIERHAFEEGFDKNKKMLGSSLPSKRLRNMAAGYISRLVRRENAKPKAA